MIFVTVGTTLPFDALIEEVDRLVGKSTIREPVVCQIGHGKYVPRHCESFPFKPSLDSYIEEASLVIGHGGTGTVTGLLRKGKRFIAVANPLGADDHQAEFLDRLSRESGFLWTADLASLGKLIQRSFSVSPVWPNMPSLADDLRIFLSKSLRQPAQLCSSTKK